MLKSSSYSTILKTRLLSVYRLKFYPEILKRVFTIVWKGAKQMKNGWVTQGRGCRAPQTDLQSVLIRRVVSKPTSSQSKSSPILMLRLPGSPTLSHVQQIDFQNQILGFYIFSFIDLNLSCAWSFIIFPSFCLPLPAF